MRSVIRRKILVWLSTGFGLGLSPFAPGTVGSIWGVLIAFAINGNLSRAVEAGG